MPTYLPCGGSPYSVLAAADQTGQNTGNLTNAFGVGVLGNMPSVYEWHRATIATQTPGMTFQPAPCSIYAGGKLVSATYPVGLTEWDPVNPVLMHNGYELDFFWQIAAGVTPVPYVTVWLRYDVTLAANQSYAGG